MILLVDPIKSVARLVLKAAVLHLRWLEAGALRLVMESCSNFILSTRLQCRFSRDERRTGRTELNCRHQPFQCINNMSINNKLKLKYDAKSDILCHGISTGYGSRCHWWHLAAFPIQ